MPAGMDFEHPGLCPSAKGESRDSRCRWKPLQWNLLHFDNSEEGEASQRGPTA